MKKEDFAALLGSIDERYIAEARAEGRSKPSVRFRWLAAAACLVPALLLAQHLIPGPEDVKAPIYAPVAPGFQGTHSGKVLPANTYLNGDAVMKIGFSHAGIAASDVQSMMLTMDDSRQPVHFDLKFLAGGDWHQYEIDAVTGEILTVTVGPAAGNEVPPAPALPGQS